MAAAARPLPPSGPPPATTARPWRARGVGAVRRAAGVACIAAAGALARDLSVSAAVARPREDGDARGSSALKGYLVRLFDVNGDGKVDASDLVALFDINGDGKVDASDLVALMDINGDGRVDVRDVAALGNAALHALHLDGLAARAGDGARGRGGRRARGAAAALFAEGRAAHAPQIALPSDLSGGVAVDATLPLPLREANRLLFGPDTAFAPEWFARANIREARIGEWERAGGKARASRSLTYTAPGTLVSAPSPARETQTYTHAAPERGVYAVDVLVDPGPKVPLGKVLRIRWRCVRVHARRAAPPLVRRWARWWR